MTEYGDWQECAFCGATPAEAEMTSDCQVGLLCVDSVACCKRVNAAAAAWLDAHGVER